MHRPCHGCLRTLSLFLVAHTGIWEVDGSQSGGIDQKVAKTIIFGIPVFSQSRDDKVVDWIVLPALGQPDTFMHDFHNLITVANMVLRGQIQEQNHASQTRRYRPVNKCITRGTKQQLETVLRLATARGMNISMVQEDRKFTILSVDEFIELSWGLDRIDNRTGLDRLYTPGVSSKGAGVHVYVVDTGVRTTHIDFGGRVVPTIDVSPMPENDGWVCAPANNSCTSDHNGHGTHVAGIAIGSTYGVASQAMGHAVKAFGSDMVGKLAAIYTALNWMLVNGEFPMVVCLSLAFDDRIPVLDTMLERMISAGAHVVAAAGNHNVDACSTSPGGVTSVLTVGATGPCDAKAAFSNYGPCVDLFAPGKDIPSAAHCSDTAWNLLSGTSQACPFVTGAAALLLGEKPNLTMNETFNLLLNSSTCGRIRGLDTETPNKLLFVGPGFLASNQSSSCNETETADANCKYLPASPKSCPPVPSVPQEADSGQIAHGFLYFLGLLNILLPH